MPSSGSQLVVSPLLSRFCLRGGWNLAWNVLAREIVVFLPELDPVLTFFATPREMAEASRAFAGDLRLLDAIARLRAAQVLTAAPADDLASIRETYAIATATPRPRVGSLRSNRPGSAPATAPHTWQLARALSVLEVRTGEWLITHPTHPPLHLSDQLWAIARSFREPIAADAAPPETARFLASRGILWRSADAEETALAAAFPVPRELLEIRKRSEHRWRHKYRPYTPDIAGLPIEREATVAIVGLCQIQAISEALRFRGQEAGWRIDTHAFLAVDQVTDGPWSLLVLAATRLAAGLYEAVAAVDVEAARREARSVAARLDDHLDLLRHRTSAPIALTTIGNPGLPTADIASPLHHELVSVLASLNATIAALCRQHGACYLLDENRLIADSRIGAYLDDEFNALPHHAPISNWDQVPGQASRAARPPLGTGQGATAAPLADAVLDLLIRLDDRPCRLVVFEPDGLLWSGHLEHRERPYPSGGPHFYTDDDHYLHAGIHEALCALRRRGIELAASSRCPGDLLRERWHFDSRLRNLVRQDDVVQIVGGGDKRENLRAVVEAAGVPAHSVLWIDPTAAEDVEFGGRVFRGDPWTLRRYLLTAPELSPLRSPGSTGGRARIEPEHCTEPALALDRVSAAVDEVICLRLRCSDEQLGASDDLRALGHDSMGALELVAAIERTLQVKLSDADLVGSVVFSRTALIQATVRAQMCSGQPGPAAPSPPQMSQEEWCEQDVSSILLHHASSPRSDWIFKFLRSGADHDVEYVGWRQLVGRASGYAAMYRRHGLAPGDLVMLLLPQGSELVAAFVGAILGGQVPSISALPSEKLSAAAFASWFGAIATGSDARLVICEPATDSMIRQMLGGTGIQIASEVPRAEPAPSLPGVGGGDAPLLLQHSSGTTGLKKAVRLSHRAVLSQVWHLATALEVTERDVVVSWLPLYHDMGLIACLMLPLLRSVPTVVMSPLDWVKQPWLLLRELSRERGTLSWMPNFALLHCATRIDDAHLDGIDLTSVRAIVDCSEPVTARAQDAFWTRLSGYGLRRSAMSSSYAMAEATFAVTQAVVGRSSRRLCVVKHDLTVDGVLRLASPGLGSEHTVELVSSGPALTGCEVEIRDAAGDRVPDGRLGEIWTRSASLMNGYHNDPVTSAAVLHDGWLRTGDLGALLDGELYVAGRTKDLVIVAGANLQPHEIEDLVSQLDGVHPGRCAAFGSFDPDQGTERLIVIAEMVAGRALSTTQARALEQRIREEVVTRFLVSPFDVQLVPYQTLAKSSSGKLARQVIKARYLEAGCRV